MAGVRTRAPLTRKVNLKAQQDCHNSALQARGQAAAFGHQRFFRWSIDFFVFCSFRSAAIWREAVFLYQIF